MSARKQRMLCRVRVNGCISLQTCTFRSYIPPRKQSTWRHTQRNVTISSYREETMPDRSSILYQNPQKSVFLIDIPASIEIAQIASFNSSSVDDVGNNKSTVSAQQHHYKQIFSSKPVEHPYPSPPEPKSEAARARLLSRIPESEILFHESIASFVRRGVDEIQQGLGGRKWCRSRRVMTPARQGNSDDKINDGATVGSRTVNEHNAISEPPRKRSKLGRPATYTYNKEKQPPLILSSSSVNEFADITGLHGIQVKNPSPLKAAMMQVEKPGTGITTKYTIPPASSFVLGNLTPSQPYSTPNISPIPRLPSTEEFDIILFDPPWPNRSVRRSSQYPTHGYLEIDSLVTITQQTILSHLRFGDDNSTKRSIVGIWTTNNAKSRQAAYDAFSGTNLEIFEVWVWIKITENGELVSPLDGLWRKPYEALFLGRPRTNMTKAHEEQEPTKRIIAAVPDEHSRKPNLKELLELLFFRDEGNEGRETPINIKQYTALEVFARNLTAGWYACGNDVLKFNADQWWYQP